LLQLSPYLWPKTSAKLQVASVACIGVIALGRVANIYTPLSLGHVIDDLTNMTRPWFWYVLFPALLNRLLPNIILPHFPISTPLLRTKQEQGKRQRAQRKTADLSALLLDSHRFSIYMFLKLAQGSGGFLSVTQSMLWAPVMQYSDRRMSTLG
jgi:hypothetical protein